MRSISIDSRNVMITSFVCGSEGSTARIHFAVEKGPAADWLWLGGKHRSDTLGLDRVGLLVSCGSEGSTARIHQAPTPL